MGKIKVNTAAVTNAANQFKAKVQSIDMPSISEDDSSSVAGNTNAHDAINDLKQVVTTIKSAGNTLAAAIANAATSFEASDDAIGR